MATTKIEEKAGMNARVTVNFSRTYQTAKFEGITFNVGMSDDVGPGETNQSAMLRVKQETYLEFNKLLKFIEGKHPPKLGAD